MLPITLTIPCAICFWVSVRYGFPLKRNTISLFQAKKKKKLYLNNKSPTPNSIPKTRARPSIGIALV